MNDFIKMFNVEIIVKPEDIHKITKYLNNNNVDTFLKQIFGYTFDYEYPDVVYHNRETITYFQPIEVLQQTRYYETVICCNTTIILNYDKINELMKSLKQFPKENFSVFIPEHQLFSVLTIKTMFYGINVELYLMPERDTDAISYLVENLYNFNVISSSQYLQFQMDGTI